jgi:hypothetical protein
VIAADALNGGHAACRLYIAHYFPLVLAGCRAVLILVA